MNKSSIVNEYKSIIRECGGAVGACGKLSRDYTRDVTQLCNEDNYCFTSYSQLAKKGKDFLV